MPTNFVLGLAAKFYYGNQLLDGNTAGDVVEVTWTEAGNVRDVTLNLETGEADVTTRANNGWRATAATLKDGSVETEMVWKPGDAFFDEVFTSWNSAGEIALAVMDGDIASGGSGLVSNFTVTNFTRSEPLEDALIVSVTFKPSSQTQWYEQGS